jgi:hypothetical protein
LVEVAFAVEALAAAAPTAVPSFFGLVAYYLAFDPYLNACFTVHPCLLDFVPGAACSDPYHHDCCILFGI